MASSRVFFKLLIPEEDLLANAIHYGSPVADAEVISVGNRARENRWLDLEGLVRLAAWKFQCGQYSEGHKKRIATNKDSTVRAATRRSFMASDPDRAINLLMDPDPSDKLKGVGGAMASVILHLCHPDPYPIWDQRALWSCGFHFTEYVPEVWTPYVEFTRGLAARLNTDMRTLDRALFGTSKFLNHKLG